MAFMISRETENVQSSEEIENAFRALSAEYRAYVTADELYSVCTMSEVEICDPCVIITNFDVVFQNLTPDQAEYCIKHMKPYVDPMTGRSVAAALDYEEFTRSLFQN